MKSICITQVPRYVLYLLYLAARDAEWDVMDVDGTVEQNRDDDGIIELYFLLLSPFFYFYLLFFFIFIIFFKKFCTLLPTGRIFNYPFIQRWTIN